MRYQRMILLLLCAVITSCAVQPKSTLYDYAHFSKRSAEGLYQAIYAASQQGKVNAHELAQARTAYAQWAIAQQGYLVAAEAGRYDVVYATAMQAQVQALLDIVERNQVPQWQRN